MLILNSAQIKNTDRYTIENEPVSSIDLMERASEKCFQWIKLNFSDCKKKFLIVCGPGNNGGDGLAIARLLRNSGYDIKVILIGEKYSDDNLQNQKRWKDAGEEIHWYNSLERFLKEDVIIIDAIFGTGLNQTPEGNYKSCIQKLNESGKKIISIDLPSGMADGKQFDFKTIIKADFTLTFQFPKLAFLLPDSGIFAGDWEIMDIGLHPDGYLHEKPVAYFLMKEMIKDNFLKRDIFSHKGTFGHACLIGGSYGKIGAMVLSAHACMKSGAGLTTVVVAECGYGILQTVLPEAMVRVSKGEFYLEDFNTGKIDFDAVGVGPGMGTEQETMNALKALIQNTNVPLVLDADALNILSENKTWLHFLPAGSILTPHPREFERLAGKWGSAYEMIELQKEFSFKFQCIVVLKGAYTSITTPGGNLFFNSTGNPGLAKGGSGDTLTGIITGLCAQGFSTLEAALSGVFLHGLAADLAVEENHEYSLMARDLISFIPEAISEIQI